MLKTRPVGWRTLRPGLAGWQCGMRAWRRWSRWVGCCCALAVRAWVGRNSWLYLPPPPPPTTVDRSSNTCQVSCSESSLVQCCRSWGYTFKRISSQCNTLWAYVDINIILFTRQKITFNNKINVTKITHFLRTFLKIKAINKSCK